MKKRITFLLITLFSLSVFAQTKVDAKKIGKTLESNKDATAVFNCDMSLSGIKVADDGTISLPLFAKNKIKIVSGMDMTNISERLDYAGKAIYSVTFGVSDLPSKTYSLTKIDGIETVEQYKERLVQEEKKRAEEARRKYEQERLANLTRQPVQVVLPQSVNVSAGEQSWLPGQLQDKIKSNFQEYLGMHTVVDAKAEKELLKIQAASEKSSHDETTSIEIGKITNAKFAVFPTLRKTANGYTLNIDFTDLTTGEQLASTLSKEYTKSEYLYGTTGAIDELTLKVAERLNIPVSEITKSLLTSGSADFTVDAQLALAKQNEEAYRRQQSNLDAEIAKLSSSTDINAVQNKKKLEAEKALLIEKQNAEAKRLQELAEQKKRAAEDQKLEAERSIALKTQRDQVAKDAAAKAAEVRKLKLEKQGVLGQINVIESKKKALVEIRQGVEARSQELYNQLVNDRASEEQKIRIKSYSTVELGSDGNPTEQAKQRRENQVTKSYEDLTNKFFTDCDAVKKATATQDASLLAEIRADQKALTATRTVSSMGDELKVSYGKYEGSANGWNAYLSLYSDGVLLYTDNFIVNYEALSGKKAPNMETELNDSVIEEYTNNVDMYNSLLTRGDPIIYFEIDYNVTAEGDDKPSQYKFNFSKIRVINTVSGKVTQTSALNKIEPRTMKPEWDLRVLGGIAAWEKSEFEVLKKYIAKYLNLTKAQTGVADHKKLYKECQESFVNIPGKNFAMMKTEVTQKLYIAIMEENPSKFVEYNNPVECISWYDAVYFCNKLSIKFGFIPVYAVNGITNPDKWEYIPHQEQKLFDVTQNMNANGFRLPTLDEWRYAAKGGQNYIFSGSDKLDEVGWFESNSNYTYSEIREGNKLTTVIRNNGVPKPQVVAQKKPNDYGLYDMSGNVQELCWDKQLCGGSYTSRSKDCTVDSINRGTHPTRSATGFRIVCSAYN